MIDTAETTTPTIQQTLTQYPAYKDSGVEGLDAIPAHWKINQLKRVARMIVSNVDKHTKSHEILVRLCNYVDVYKNNFITDEITFAHASASLDEIKKFRIKINDVIITKDSEDWLDIGVPALVKYESDDLICGYHLAILRADKKITGKYLYRAFESIFVRTQLSVKANGVTRYGLSHNAILAAFIPLPPLAEQTRITEFLDRKTAQIDQAIAQKKQLIELLNERRQVMIHQAVTRGLDLNVPTKDCVIERVDEIPAHWQVKRLKFLGEIRYGLGQPPKEKDGGLPLIRATNVERGKIVEKGLLFVDPSDIPWNRNPELKENDIIIVRSGAYTADSAIISKKYAGSIAGYDMVMTPKCINAMFLSFVLLSNYVLQNQLYLLRMRAAQPHLNVEELGETLILVPPIHEQEAISKTIMNDNYKVEKAIACKYNEIQKLQELKSTLINSAVTGKIKV